MDTLQNNMDKTTFCWFTKKDCSTLKNHIEKVLAKLNSYDSRRDHGLNETTIKTLIISHLIASNKDLSITSEFAIKEDMSSDKDKVIGFSEGQKYCDILLNSEEEEFQNQFILIEVKHVPLSLVYTGDQTDSNGNNIYTTYILPRKQKNKNSPNSQKTSPTPKKTNRDEMDDIVNAFNHISLNDREQLMKLKLFATPKNPTQQFDKNKNTKLVSDFYKEAQVQLEDYLHYFNKTKTFSKIPDSKMKGLLVIVVGNKALVEFISSTN